MIQETFKTLTHEERYQMMLMHQAGKITTEEYLASMDAVRRHEYTDKNMWALVTWEWVRPFAEWINGRKVLEVMSGAGWLAYALRELGVNIVATDDFSWHKQVEPQTEIERLDAVDAVVKYGKDVDILIMSWPPYNDSIAHQVLLKMREVNPNLVMIYVGEDQSGCNATDDFFESAHYVDDDKINKINSFFPQWDGIHDYIYLIK